MTCYTYNDLGAIPRTKPDLIYHLDNFHRSVDFYMHSLPGVISDQTLDAVIQASIHLKRCIEGFKLTLPPDVQTLPPDGILVSDNVQPSSSQDAVPRYSYQNYQTPVVITATSQQVPYRPPDNQSNNQYTVQCPQTSYMVKTVHNERSCTPRLDTHGVKRPYPVNKNQQNY